MPINCRREYHQQYTQRPGVQKRKNLQNRQYYWRLKEKVRTLLGRVCILCGCEEERWLTIDHIGGGGKEHVKQCNGMEGVCRAILKDPHAKKKYRTLCYGCNCLRAVYSSDRALKVAIRREHARIRKHV